MTFGMEPPIERSDRDSLCDSLNDPAEEEEALLAVRCRTILHRYLRRAEDEDDESDRLEWEAEKLAEADALLVVFSDEPVEGYDAVLHRDDPCEFNADDPGDRAEEEGRRAAARYTVDL